MNASTTVLYLSPTLTYSVIITTQVMNLHNLIYVDIMLNLLSALASRLFSVITLLDHHVFLSTTHRSLSMHFITLLLASTIPDSFHRPVSQSFYHRLLLFLGTVFMDQHLRRISCASAFSIVLHVCRQLWPCDTNRLPKAYFGSLFSELV